ncbi:hypothetical protein CBS101457_003390 [Exobasidium rhododendri]|nr:hypothetical protein CBS101457_003390 [Exobasidium rhododendri]
MDTNIFIPVRHGGLPGLTPAAEGDVGFPASPFEEEPMMPMDESQAVLRLPVQASSVGRIGKAPRIRGVSVEVDFNWLLENVIGCWSSLVGAIEYLVIILALPTLSPTSLPPILALLSLRSQLGTLVKSWTSARRSLECLEFVRRRWAAIPLKSSMPTPRWRAAQQEEIMCPICLESIRGDEEQESGKTRHPDVCLLDCGHELHAVCLVQIYLDIKYAFCPCCHDPLRAVPAVNPSNATAM